MKWKKRGLIFNHSSKVRNISGAMCPTPEKISDTEVKVYISSRDEFGRARIFYVNCDFLNDSCKIPKIGESPFFDIGTLGTFDDNGCIALSIVKLSEEKRYLYYVGFELCEKIRYRLFTGLAISEDGGNTFKRYSNVPILDRSDKEFCFRCGPFVTLENGIFRMWYVAGSDWQEIDNKQMPVYVIKYLESKDGIHWGDCGKVCIDIEFENEHGFGRPYIIKDGKIYKMFYSKRIKHLGYRMGYAESKDGIEWTRKDDLMNLDVSASGWDSKIICYPAVFKVNERWIMLYNGNGFGETGFGYAELVSW